MMKTFHKEIGEIFASSKDKPDKPLPQISVQHQKHERILSGSL